MARAKWVSNASNDILPRAYYSTWIPRSFHVKVVITTRRLLSGTKGTSFQQLFQYNETLCVFYVSQVESFQFNVFFWKKFYKPPIKRVNETFFFPLLMMKVTPFPNDWFIFFPPSYTTLPYRPCHNKPIFYKEFLKLIKNIFIIVDLLK